MYEYISDEYDQVCVITIHKIYSINYLSHEHTADIITCQFMAMHQHHSDHVP